MAVLKIYKTDILLEKNPLVEDLQTYLSGLTPVYVSNNFQYQKITNLDKEIKIDASQLYVGQSIGDYIDLYQDNKHYYFYIIKSEWKAESTIALTITLDTVNTYFNELSWTNETHITRQHKDRFIGKNSYSENGDGILDEFQWSEEPEGYHGVLTINLDNRYSNLATIVFIAHETFYEEINTWYELHGETTLELHISWQRNYVPQGEYAWSINESKLVRKIDPYYEPFESTYIKTSTKTISDSENNNKWYLIYKSDNVTNDYQPVRCYACADEQVKFVTGGTFPSKTGIQLRSEIGSYDHYYFVYTNNNPYDTTITGSGWSGSLSTRYNIIRIDVSGNKMTPSIYDSVTASVSIGTATNFIDLGINKSRMVFYSNTATYNILEIFEMNSKIFLSGNLGDVYINSIDEYNIKDPTNIKIIECAYAPFNVEFNIDGEFQIPTGWKTSNVESNILLELEKVNSNLINNNLDKLDLNDIFRINDIVNVNDSASITRESKLFNSQFSYEKVTYDTVSYIVKNELIENYNLNTNIKFDLQFKQSNTISSDCGFKLTNTGFNYKEEVDYDKVIVSTRNNESPVYNSAWLNYSKYSRKYDVQKNATGIAASFLGAGATAMSSIASSAVFGIGSSTALGPAGLAITIASVAISAIITTINSSIQADLTQKQKDSELLNQAASVTGSNDLDIFRWYGDNKLKVNSYECRDYIKKLIYDYLRYYGYACSDYGIPVTNTRYWYNHIQCEPVFNRKLTNIYESFLNDIKGRYKIGVTVFHKRLINGVPTWDFTQEKENWETSLVEA